MKCFVILACVLAVAVAQQQAFTDCAADPQKCATECRKDPQKCAANFGGGSLPSGIPTIPSLPDGVPTGIPTGVPSIPAGIPTGIPAGVPSIPGFPAIPGSSSSTTAAPSS